METWAWMNDQHDLCNERTSRAAKQLQWLANLLRDRPAHTAAWTDHALVVAGIHAVGAVENPEHLDIRSVNGEPVPGWHDRLPSIQPVLHWCESNLTGFEPLDTHRWLAANLPVWDGQTPGGYLPETVPLFWGPPVRSPFGCAPGVSRDVASIILAYAEIGAEAGWKPVWSLAGITLATDLLRIMDGRTGGYLHFTRVAPYDIVDLGWSASPGMALRNGGSHAFRSDAKTMVTSFLPVRSPESLQVPT